MRSVACITLHLFFIIFSISQCWEHSDYLNRRGRSVYEFPNKIKRNINKWTIRDETKDTLRFLEEVENAFQRSSCGRPSLSPPSKALAMLEQSLFSSAVAASKLLAEIVADAEVTSTERELIRIFAHQTLHSLDFLEFIEVFVEPSETGQQPTFMRLLRNSSNAPQEMDRLKMEDVVEISKHTLRSNCSGNKPGRRVLSKVVWTKPFSNCNDQMLLGLFSIIYACSGAEIVSIKGYVELSIDTNKIDIDQCSKDASNPFARTNACPSDSVCHPVKNYGLRDGGYTCTCLRDVHTRHQVINGSTIIRKGTKTVYSKHPCHACLDDNASCSGFFALPEEVAVAGLSVHIIVMLVMLLPGLLVAKLRKTKTLSFNFWQLYEVMLGGGLLVYLSVVVDYMPANEVTCIAVSWLRELGFAVLYSSMMLKIYRMRVECRSRQAQRVLLRDKDLVRYLAIILFLVTWQMVAWTAIKIEGIVDHKGTLREYELNDLCEVGLWHHVVEAEEFIVLVCFVYLCCSISPPPSFATECRTITFALLNEAIFSALHNALKHIVTSSLSHRGNFMLSLVRCHLTISINLIVLLGIKLLQARTSSHVVSSCRRKDGSAVNSKEGAKAVDHEPLKNQTSKKSQENKDSNDINLSGLSPEDVKAELRRLYKQLEIYKVKSSRKDVSHNIKKQTTRKQGPRRFSLYNFHQSRHSKHHQNLMDKTRGLDDCTEKEHSRTTPEESTNSCEQSRL